MTEEKSRWYIPVAIIFIIALGVFALIWCNRKYQNHMEQKNAEITVSPLNATQYTELTDSEEVISLTSRNKIPICEVKAWDYTNNWLSNDLVSLVNSALEFYQLHKDEEGEPGGEIVIPKNAAVSDVILFKTYSWHEENESGYKADHYVIFNHDEIVRLDCVSKNRSSVAISLYCGKRGIEQN